MEDNISKKDKLEYTYWLIAVFSILISLIIAINYKEPFWAEIVILIVLLAILAPLRKYINLLDEKNVTKIISKDEEIITLIKFLNKYSKSEKYSSVIKNEKDASLKSLLIKYKESFLEDILRTEVMTYKEMSLEKDISIENPEVGDLLVAIGRLKSDDVEKI